MPSQIAKLKQKRAVAHQPMVVVLQDGQPTVAAYLDSLDPADLSGSINSDSAWAVPCSDGGDVDAGSAYLVSPRAFRAISTGNYS